MNIDKRKFILIQRFVTGNANPEEVQALQEWMAKDSANKKLVREIKEIWDRSPSEDFTVDVDSAWQRFQSRKTNVAESINSGSEVKHLYANNRSRKFLYIFRAAAVILVVLFAGYLVQTNRTVQSEGEDKVPEFYLMQTFETSRGEKARITFSDGSQVLLNSASSLQFPKEFKGSTRKVHLKGEAYFEVVHDESRPFIVEAQGTEVEVLGTKFNVRGWEDDVNVEVAVREGKVSVRSLEAKTQSQSKNVILTKGLSTSVYDNEAPLPPKQVDITSHLLWTEGGLYFDNDPFSQVIKDIERRFDVRISGLNQNLMEIPYTGTFKYADLDEVLTVIAASINEELEYQRQGSEIKFIH